MTRALALAVALLAPVATAHAADAPPALGVGAVAPETTLSDQRGQTVRLADLLKQHQWVVLAFYVKAFTGG